MSLPTRPVLVRGAEAETLGTGSDTTTLLLDAHQTGSALNAVRTRLSPGTSGPPPHYHRRAPETFFLLDGALDVLVDNKVVALAAGDVLLVPAGAVHAWATPADSAADMLITKSPATDRFDYFRIADRVRRGLEDPRRILETGERFDNHFTASAVWREHLVSAGRPAPLVAFPREADR
jgi:quercetin dioxygenase-like cupin family protein